MTAFRTQPPDLRETHLMDMDFAVIGPLVRCLAPLSGFCPSARAFARHFLQTSLHIDALVLCYPSPPSGWWKTFTSKLSYMLGAPTLHASLTGRTWPKSDRYYRRQYFQLASAGSPALQMFLHRH
jgi:hypothetical protein